MAIVKNKLAIRSWPREEAEIRRDERGSFRFDVSKLEHFSLFLFSLLSFGGRHLITVKGVHVDSKGRFLRGAVTDFMHSCADAAGGFLKTESDTGRGGRRGREKTGGEARRQLSYTFSRDTAPYEREKTRGGTVRDKKERIKAEFFFLFIFIYSFFLSFLSPEDVRNRGGQR